MGVLLCAMAAGSGACNTQADSKTGTDDTETSSARGGAVGFVTGQEQDGPVPSDGTSEDAPKVLDVTIDADEIGEGEPLLIAVEFEDTQGDVQVVHFGIEGEDTHYVVSVGILVSGAQSGTIALELFPKSYVPGRYTLNLSLTDALGNTSAMAELPFIIRKPDGTLPDDTGGEADTDSRGADSADTEREGTGEGDTGEDTGAGTGPTFLMGYSGNSETGEPAALVTVTPTGGEPVIETLTEVVPSWLGGYGHDYKAGRLAFVADRELQEEGRGPIAVIDIDNPSDTRWVPIPESSDEDYAYEVLEQRPQLLSDGRVVYHVVYITVNPYDDFREGQLALWDPDSDALTLQGGLSTWHGSQPEVAACNPACDMELGYVSGSFAVSPDDRYVYVHIIGMGVEMMIIHTGYSYLARWDTVTGVTERLLYLETDAQVWTVTGDNAYAVLSHAGKWRKYDIARQTLVDFDDKPTTVRVGQTSQSGPVIMKGWRQCGSEYGGVALFDLEGDTSVRVIDPALYEYSHKGINANVQMNRDASEVYFTASADACTNYQVAFTVMKSPAVENNPEPTPLFTLDGLYNTSFFTVLY